MLSTERALDYVTSSLGVKDVERRLENDALGLANEIIRKFHNKVPFQNLHLMSLREEERKVPTVEENIDFVLDGSGGLCWTLNSFMFCLLKALDYHTEAVVASVYVPGANDHMVTMLRHVVTKGDHYLVEVGFGSPCFQAIPLDFEKESETLQESFQFYKYVKLENGSYLRKTRSVRREREEGSSGTKSDWSDEYWFNLDPVDLDYFMQSMTSIYVTGSRGPFLKNLHCVRFFDNQCVAVKNDTLLLEDADGVLQPTQLATPGDIISALGEYFPEISSNVVSGAVENWWKLQKKRSKSYE